MSEAQGKGMADWRRKVLFRWLDFLKSRLCVSIPQHTLFIDQTAEIMRSPSYTGVYYLRLNCPSSRQSVLKMNAALTVKTVVNWSRDGSLWFVACFDRQREVAVSKRVDNWAVERLDDSFQLERDRHRERERRRRRRERGDGDRKREKGRDGERIPWKESEEEKREGRVQAIVRTILISGA